MMRRSLRMLAARTHSVRLSALKTAAGLLVAAGILAPSCLAGIQSGSDLYNDYFANVLDGPPCFARTYDDAYLALHKAHKVRSIEIDLAKFNSDGSPNSPDRFELGLGILTRFSPEWFGQTASCRATGGGFDCFLEADGGVFRLIPRQAGVLRLETGEAGIAIEGDEMLVLSGKSGEDRVFDLNAAKAECDAAADFFNGAGD